MEKRRPFIIDCDTGTDDAIAIIAACNCDAVEIKALTSVTGNVAQESVCRNNLNLAEYLDLDLLVAQGACRPFCGTPLHAHGAHGNTGLGSVVLPEARTRTFDPRTSSQLIYDIAVEEKGELELLVIGPMTNVGIALMEHPDLPQLIRHIWFMGGSVIGGNVSTTAEFNIWADPESAHLVLQSGIPLTMVGLDVTKLANMTEEDEQELRAHGTRAAVVAADLIDYMLHGRPNFHMAIMHDALAFASAVYPECLTCKDYFVDVECNGTYTRGHTAVDLRGSSGKAPNVSVALEIDVLKFRRWLVDTIKKSK